MIVDVTAMDIRDGRRGSANSCAFALAVRRKVRAWSVWVGTEQVESWDARNDRSVYDLSEPAQTFVSDFDAGRPVDPARFNLRSR